MLQFHRAYASPAAHPACLCYSCHLHRVRSVPFLVGTFTIGAVYQSVQRMPLTTTGPAPALPLVVPHLVYHYDNTIPLSLRNTRWLDGERREINKICSCCESNLGSEASWVGESLPIRLPLCTRTVSGFTLWSNFIVAVRESAFTIRPWVRSWVLI